MYEMQHQDEQSAVWFPYANPGKNLHMNVKGKRYIRHAVRTHYIQVGKDDYIELVKRYVLPLYKLGDILSLSEKIIALCQNRVVYKKDIKVSWLARFLSKFVHMTPAGEAVGNPYKMQLAIEGAGIIRVLIGASIAAVTRPFGIRGWFYRIVGNNVANIDGFCNDAFDDYLEMGILSPADPHGVCNEIREKTGVICMIVDANDYGVEILGVCKGMAYSNEELAEIMKDNPAGQENESTPMILIRPLGYQPVFASKSLDV